MRRRSAGRSPSRLPFFRAFGRGLTEKRRASSGTKNGGSTGQPRFSLAAFSSFAPSGEPCAALVFCFSGAPKPIVVWRRMSEGLIVSASAAASARSTAAVSFPSSTAITCQPEAANRLSISSVKQSNVVPEREIRLSSYRRVSFPRPRCPASAQASAESPSIRSPSLAKT